MRTQIADCQISSQQRHKMRKADLERRGLRRLPRSLRGQGMFTIMKGVVRKFKNKVEKEG
jgi:hypothetical protein